MFTGIIESLGTIKKRTPSRQGIGLAVEADVKWTDLRLGESIAVSGVCLTVVSFSASVFTVDVSPETVSRTTFVHADIGTRVNLERALRPTDRLGGHIVTGHVDSCGTIVGRREQAEFTLFEVAVPEGFSGLIIEKGSIALDGISLTVNGCSDSSFSVSIIPFTAKHTTIGLRNEGDPVNLEFDIIGKYVQKLVAGSHEKGSQKERITTDFLAKHGFA
ncbi:MAG: riboflavin synthase [Pseudomonadota bacterium]